MEDLDSLETDLKIIGGDFNLVLDVKIDKKSGLPHTNDNARRILASYVDQNNLIDVWRDLHPGEFKFTWKRINPTPVFVRLDFFLVSDLVDQTTTIADILPGFQTDHSIPHINISFSNDSYQPTEYFLKLEKRNQNTLNALKEMKGMVL